MTREIVPEKFAENFDTEYVSCDFPLISVMCAKNDYTGCHILKLVTDEGVVAMGIVDPDGYPLNTKLCAFEVRHDCRHTGYGKELLQHILINYDDVRAVVIREALGFYRKCFFKVIEDNGGQVVTVESIA